MATINLAPGTQYAVALRRRRQRLFLISGALLAAGVAAWGVLAFMTSQAKAAQEEASKQLRIVDLTIAEAQNDAKRVVAFENRLQTVNALLDHHIVWNPIFTELERLLPASTLLTNITVNAANGHMEVQGTTADVDALAQTLASIHTSPTHQTLFTDAVLLSTERSGSSADSAPPYKFLGTFTFKPAAVVPGK